MSDRDLKPLSVQYEEAENAGSNTSSNPTMGDVIAARYSRRDIMRGALAVSAISSVASPLAMMATREAQAATPTFNFKEIAAGSDEHHYVAEGYDADVLIRWGDKVLPTAPQFDPQKQSGASQAGQFGYNNDYLGYIPLDGSSEHGLLVVNHEYTNEELMFPGVGRQDTKEAGFKGITRDLVDIELMAHGGSVLEIRKTDGKWAVVPDSKCAAHHR